MNERLQELESQLAAGRRLVERRECRPAIEHLTHALTLAREINQAECVYKAHEALSLAYELAGDLSKALRHYKAFHHLREEALFADAGRKLHEPAGPAARGREPAAAPGELQELQAALQEADALRGALRALLRRQAEELERQSREDALTGLYNRRFFDAFLAQEFDRARRFNRDLTVALADIDRFKEINDRFSTPVGDEVLRVIARLLKQGSRASDCVARYGGEEFALLLVEAPVQVSAAACERIRQRVAEHPWGDLHPDLRVTISIGLSGDLTAAGPDKLLAAAAAKLYEAKRQGRDRVVY